MSDTTALAHASPNRAFLWVDLTRQPSTSLSDSLDGAFEIRRVREPLHIFSAISIHAPAFVCFEFEACGESGESDARGIESLTRVRNEHPTLPVLVIAGPGSMIVALWALRLRVWDLLIKPVAHDELSQRILALASMIPAAQSGIRHVVEPASTSLPHTAVAPSVLRRTSPAVAYVAAHFDRKIGLEDVAGLCQLSPWQFCRAFRKEHAMSFGQYLLHFRMERACERLALPDALVKQVAYAVGFNDVSYFTRSFRREFGVCPSAYQLTARPHLEPRAEMCEASLG